MADSLSVSRMLIVICHGPQEFFGCLMTSLGMEGLSPVKYSSFCLSVSMLDTKFTCSALNT